MVLCALRAKHCGIPGLSHTCLILQYEVKYFRTNDVLSLVKPQHIPKLLQKE